MVDRISLLRNIGQFDSVSLGQEIAFAKVALVYAENGRGKTTLATILRSLGTNNSVLITERQRLGASHAPHVVINADNQTYIFQNGTWSGNLSDIAVFDDNFVTQNVCSGIEIEAGHKQNLHELILGAQGVALSIALQTHVSKIEDHNRAIKLKEAAIPANIRGTLSVDAFCALQPNVNIEADIQNAERSLSAARSAEAIKQQNNFKPFGLPAFDADEIETTLQSDLPGLQAEVTANVQKHLSKLGKGAETWIGEGMQKIESASQDKGEPICPFCAQSLQNSDIIAHYESYFSEGYASLRRMITEQGKAISAAHDPEIQSAFERDVRLTVQTGEFWRKFMEVPEIEIDTAEIARAWKAAREPILVALRAKLASPLEKMSLAPEIYSAIAAYNAHRASIEATSKKLINCNVQVALVKEKALAANVAVLSADLAKLKLTQLRHNNTYAPLCQDYIDEKNAKKATELLRDNARKSLDQYRANIFTQYEAAINTYLEKFNAGFRLSSITSMNHRGGSSCTYSVLINNVTVPLTADSGPSFKNTLSAGDRNTLALSFFFASLDQDHAVEQKIVVIDDPMTSLDAHRSLATIQEVRDLASRVKQVIILSHSKPFLCQVWAGADRTCRSALKIVRSGQSSTIDMWDVHQDCITEHDKRYALIQNYIAVGNSGKEREVATALRYILEAFLRVAYPLSFPPETVLGNFYNQCVQAVGTATAILSQADTAELRKLMDYANKFHHDTNSAYATAVINDQELLDHCARTLRFTQKT